MSKWYSLNDVLSHNKFVNFVIGQRGPGKTFDFKRWAINDFKKTGKQFVYVRRYKSELDKEGNNIKQFFDDIKFKYPKDEFGVKGGKFYINGEIAGYYIALSTAMTKKSVPYPLVNKICYDEFIIEEGSIRYLKNEVKCFLDLVFTIIRDRDDVKLILLGNSISVINPFFLYWNIKPDLKRRFNKYDDIVVELYTNETYTKEIKATRFGRLVEGTDYGRYSIENMFVNDSYEFIEEKTDNASYGLTIIYEGYHIGIWFDYDTGTIYANFKADISFPLTFTLTNNDHRPNMLLLQNANNNTYVKMLKKGYIYGCVRFESLKIKNIMFEIFKLLQISGK